MPTIKTILKNSSRKILSSAILGMIFISCAGSSLHSEQKNSSSKHKKENETSERQSGERLYTFTDASGTYRMKRDVQLIKSTNSFITKYQVISDDGKVLEQSVTIGEPGFVKMPDGKELKILRPKTSQYIVWLEKRKYTTKQSINLKTKSMDLVMTGREASGAQKKSVRFPKGNGVYCFFTQLAECVARTGFPHEAKENKAGSMNFYLIWDSYPYVQEQFSNIEDSLFTKVSFEYEQEYSNGDVAFNLKTKNHVIIYHLDNHMRFKKLFWVSQGLSIIPEGESADVSASATK